MKRLSAALAVAALAVAAAPAGAAPGASFPEQPGIHPQTACATVTTNPGSGTSGRAGQVISPTAGAIVAGLIADACLGG
jgi:hypothetical protein